MSRPSAIQPVSQTAAFIRMCVYGDNGVGKTPLIASSKRCLLLDADGGTASARSSQADRWEMRDWGDMDEALDYLQTQGHRDYDWVWLDSISGWQDRGLAHIMADLHAAKPHRHTWAPDKGEFGQNMNRIKEWVRNVNGVPINFGMTAHPFRYEDDTEEEPSERIWPWIQGRNMPQTIMGYFDVIGYMTRRRTQSGDVVPVIYFGGLEKVTSRDRYKALPERVANPNMIKIEEVIRKKIGATPPSSRPVGAAKKSLPIKKAAPAKVAAKKVAASPQRSK